MVGIGGNGNPFRPGAGRMPPLLAGREDEIALAERRLRELAGGVPPSRGLLLYGPRGNGKSVLLERIAERARSLALRAEHLPPAALTDREQLVRTLQERAGLIGDRLSGVQVGPFGGSIERAALTRDATRLFAAWVRAESSPLVVLLDEVHTLTPTVGAEFFNATHAAGAGSLPFLIVAAGTPGAPAHLRRAATFTKRDLQRRPIGRLDAASTRAALVEPASAAGRPLSARALELLAEASQRYPYFIQILGSAAWDAAAPTGNTTVTLAAAEHGVAAARGEMGQFYAERFTEAEECGLRHALHAVGDLFAGGAEQVSDMELEAALADAAGSSEVENWIALRAGLTDLGILWGTGNGEWEPGIPSFADHVLRRGTR